MSKSGSALFVLMFAVLCMSIFTLITYTSVNADKQLAEHGAALFKEYYEADLLAEQVTDGILSASEIPASVLGVDIHTSEDMFTGTAVSSFACPATNEKELFVELQITPEGLDILQWKIRTIEEWVPDDDLPVLQGGGSMPWLK